MSEEEPSVFTQNLENFRRIIDPGKRPAGRSVFPRALTDEENEKRMRVSGAESVHQWFVRCVDDVLGGDPGACSVEENLAIFLVVDWDKSGIIYVNCQVLHAEKTLDDYYLDDSIAAQYLRMDYDLSALGPMFKEPLPHVHVRSDGEPRFSVELDASGDIVSGFIDFVYRNYYHEEWIEWARSEWERACAEGRRENAWARIEAAYKGSMHRVLVENHRQDLTLMKRRLIEARQMLFPRCAPSELCRLLSYNVRDALRSGLG